MAGASFLKRQRTPTRELIRSGTVSKVSLTWNLAEQSKTTLSFPGFLGWYTSWWDIYKRTSSTAASLTNFLDQVDHIFHKGFVMIMELLINL